MSCSTSPTSFECLNLVRRSSPSPVRYADDEADGTERQSIKDLDGSTPRPRIKLCSICDPFILIIREDDTIGLFIGEIERGKIRRKDMSPMGDKVNAFRLLLLRNVRAHSDADADVQVSSWILLHGYERALPDVLEHGASSRDTDVHAAGCHERRNQESMAGPRPPTRRC